MRIPLSLPPFVIALLLAPPLLAQGGILYGTDLTPDALGSIDRTTAAYTVIGPHGTGANMTGLAWNAISDILYAVSPNGDALYRIDQVTGAATLIGPTGFSNVNALAHDPNTNTLYAADLNGNALFTIDPMTGAGTLIATITGAAAVEGLGFDAVNNVLYGLDDGPVERVVILDTATGVATPLPTTLPVSGLWRGLDFDPELNVVWATTVNPGRLYRVDPVTGAGTLVGSLPSFIQSLAFKGGMPTGPLYQVNQPQAAIDIDGVIGTPTILAQVMFGTGQIRAATLTSTLTGASWELAFGVAPPISTSQGALIASDGQILNINLTDPTLVFLWNGFQSPPFANFSVPISSPQPLSASFQMALIDLTTPSGLRLSQPVRLVVQ